MSNEPQTCKVCGARLPASAPGGPCPVCLVRSAMGQAGEMEGGEAQSSVEVTAPMEQGPGAMIGRYKLLEKVGEGGFGTVYVAEQREPVKRRVALKIIKLGMDSKQVIARFEAERQALAMMDHPNIAKALEAGATDTGRPYFVMELVRGIKITDYCGQNNLSTPQRLDLFISVCQAIQHAHQKGIIHRDIKPSNILVTLHDGVPVPRVIDFGIAKATQGQLTDKTVYTQLQELIGTPAYMSPEQAEMSGLDIDTRADVYSLGVLLYELLTGKTPFDAEDLLEAGLEQMRRTICEKQPLRPSTRLTNELTSKSKIRNPKSEMDEASSRRLQQLRKLIELLRGDLDWIVMKCLEKDRTRRYETANGLAMDVQRYLKSEPVVARPPSQLYRLQKLARRNRTAFAAGAAVMAALLIGLAVSAWQAIRATHAQRSETIARLAADQSRALAVEREQTAQRLLYGSDMKLAYEAWEEGNLSLVHSLLNAHRPKPGEADLRGFEYFCLQELAKGEQEQVLRGHTNQVFALAVSPDGKWLASRGKTDTRLWDLGQRRQVAAWPAPPPSRFSAEDSGVGQGISFSHDSEYLVLETETGLQLCRIPTLQTRPLATGPAQSPLFSPATNWLAFEYVWGSEPQVRVWDYLADKRVGPPGLGPGLTCWSPDGSRLGTGQVQDIGVAWWEVPTFRCVETNRVAQWVFGAAVSPNGRVTAAADWQGEIWLFESPGGRLLGTLPGDAIRASTLAFSPDSKFLATPGRDEAISIWDLESRNRARRLRGHEGKVMCLAYSPDGKLLVSGGMDGAIMLWEPNRETRRLRIPNQLLEVQKQDLTFSSDGKWLSLAPGPGFSSAILDSSSLQTVARRHGVSAALSPDSSQAAVTWGPNAEPALHVSKIAASSPRVTVHYDSPFGTLGRGRLSPDGTLLASPGYVWKSDSGERLLTLPISAFPSSENCFLPGGEMLAHSVGPRIGFWNLRSRQEEFALDVGSPVTAMSVSPNGRVLACARMDFKISLWDLGSRIEFGLLSGHQGFIWPLAFAPDGRTLASGSEDRTIKLWQLSTLREMASLAQAQAVYYLGFSPNGQMLVSGGIGSYQIWRAPRGENASLPSVVPATLTDLPTNSVWRLADGERPPPPRVLLEKEKCFANLLKVHAAIMAYRRDRQQMPNSLTDLVPDYLSDTNALTCPDYARTPLRTSLSDPNPRAATTYSYQFSGELSAATGDPDGLAAPGDTMKLLSAKQLELYGEVVPVVRCHRHPYTLNVTLAGERMESEPDDWGFAAARCLRSRHRGEFEDFCIRMERQGSPRRLQAFAWHWATSGNAEERDGTTAVRFAQKAVELLNRRDPGSFDTLAAAYAEKGQFDEAARVELEAMSLPKGAPADFKDEPQEFEVRLKLYGQRKPCRE